MRFPNPQEVFRKIAENPQLTQKARLSALAAIRKPSLSMLIRLYRNPDTPSRLKIMAAKLYEKAITQREVSRVLNEDHD